MQHKIESLDCLRKMVGEDLGSTQWHQISQKTIDAFADVTGDTERIHLDPRAAEQQNLNSTIAHGLFVLSLGPKLLYELMSVQGYSRVLNYGYEKVRFLAPIPVNSSVRMRAKIAEERPTEGGSIIMFEQTFELMHPNGEILSKPACYAEAVVVYFD